MNLLFYEKINKKEDVFLPLNKILKYNNKNERREPQTLNHSKKQFSSISKTQSIQIKTDDDTIYNFKAYSYIDLAKTGEKVIRDTSLQGDVLNRWLDLSKNDHDKEKALKERTTRKLLKVRK